MTATRRTIATRDAPEAIGPYSQAVLVDGWLWCSGQIALDPASGALLANDAAAGPATDRVRAQTVRALANLRAVLTAGGASPADVVRTTVYLTDMAHFAVMNEEYARVFGGPAPPARATVAAAGLPKGALVEIDCVARVPGGT